MNMRIVELDVNEEPRLLKSYAIENTPTNCSRCKLESRYNVSFNFGNLQVAYCNICGECGLIQMDYQKSSTVILIPQAIFNIMARLEAEIPREIFTTANFGYVIKPTYGIN